MQSHTWAACHILMSRNMWEATCNECPFSLTKITDKLSAKLMTCLYGVAFWHMMATSINKPFAVRTAKSLHALSNASNQRQVLGNLPRLDAKVANSANLVLGMIQECAFCVKAQLKRMQAKLRTMNSNTQKLDTSNKHTQPGRVTCFARQQRSQGLPNLARCRCS